MREWGRCEAFNLLRLSLSRGVFPLGVSVESNKWRAISALRDTPTHNHLPVVVFCFCQATDLWSVQRFSVSESVIRFFPHWKSSESLTEQILSSVVPQRVWLKLTIFIEKWLQCVDLHQLMKLSLHIYPETPKRNGENLLITAWILLALPWQSFTETSASGQSLL